MTDNRNITWHDYTITKKQRRNQNGHESFIIWFTGLSGSGKSTIANALAKALFIRKINNYVLDGDNIRHGLNKDLGFSEKERTENIRRIGEISKLFVDSGLVILTAFISPFQEDRDQVRQLVEPKEFIEIYVKCTLDECEKRDSKKLYQKARAGEIKNFTGIDSPYEEPVNPELVVETDTLSIEECVNKIIIYLETMKLI
ncbi:adenylyl-sulfate kinase [Priestia megaterium]|uniref:adenylyl-sulfate kinase n=1 Tax=Priestia megaterium TaxID=1404 RepID=UPI002079568E|nr:adenylyl-sulfate kinase [Priestia megaterium]USL45757.1 adenylyl-sulfate kinase [Priestia megaterium]